MGPIDHGVVRHLPKPSAESPFAPVQLELRQLPQQRDEDALHYILGVVLVDPFLADVTNQEGFVNVDELPPTLAVGGVAEAAEQ